jgi:hypothetical protein
MAAAVPLDIDASSLGYQNMRATAAPTASGAPGIAGGSQPNGPFGPSAGQVRQAQAALNAASGGSGTPVPLDGSFPGPNQTFYYGPKFQTFPIGTVGKLFFTDPTTGGGFQCTASVTTATATILNVIWTAGHCVANGGHSYFYTNFEFCPSYNSGGVNPQRGCWVWDGGASVFTVWFANGDLTRDEAYITLQHTGTVWSTDVANVTGSLGFAWNWPRDQHWFHYGYPCVNWDCVDIVETAAEHRYDVNIGGSGPFVNSWGSGQTEGSSGSSVILFFSYGGGDINSNVSFYFSSGPNGNEHGIEIQGPYYDSTVCTLWKAGTGWPGTC